MKRRNEKILYLVPALLLALFFTYLPLMRAFRSSFLSFKGPANFVFLFTDRWFLKSIANTILFALIFVPMNTALVLLAASLTREKTGFNAAMGFVFSSPIAVSIASYSIIFKEMFLGKVNIVNRILMTDIPWLEQPGSAMFVLALLGVFLDFGLDYLLILSSFGNIESEIKDAAAMDGAGKLATYTKIELPLIMPMLEVTIFLSVKDALLICSPVLLLTEGGPFRSTETIMYYYYIEAFKSSNYAIGNTISVLSVVCSALLLSVLTVRRKRKW